MTHRRDDSPALRSAEAEIASLRDTISRLETRLNVDEQTGVMSKAAFYDHYAANASDGDCVAFVDIDDFRSVNDTYGADFGDRLLKRIVDALVQSVAQSGWVARLVGDEYILHLPVQQAPDARALLDRVRRAVATTTVPHGELTVGRTASLGVARVANGMTAREALIEANQALREAKARGKNRCVLPEDRSAPMPRQPSVEEIRLALRRREFQYHVQPIVQVSTMEVSGFEALLRWHRPDGEVLGPARFLSTMTAAYGDATTPPLEAAHAVATWAARDRGKAIAFNVSAEFLEQLERNGLDWARTIVGDIPWSLVVFELVETMILHEHTPVASMISGLRDRGVRIALDDFGIGHSTLERLQALPVDLVKIDRRFLHAATRGGRDRAMLEAMLRIAEASGAQTVVEGVETEEHLVLARQLGANFVQGFLLGRPARMADWDDRCGGPGLTPGPAPTG